MKTKAEMIAALEAARISFNQTMTVAELKELCEANGISTSKTVPVLNVEDEDDEDDEPSDQEIIAAKVRAGLTLEQAVEVHQRQVAADRLPRGLF